MKLSCQLFPWRDDAVSGLAGIAEVGFPACEFGSHVVSQYEKDPGRLLELLEVNRLQVSAVFAQGNFNAERHRRETLLFHDKLGLLLSRLGIANVILSPGVKWKRSLDLEDRKRMLSLIVEIDRRYRQHGVGTAIHPHRGSSIFRREEIDEVMAYVPDRVGLVLDTGHTAEAGLDVLSLLQEYAGRIPALHVKDAVLNRRPQAGGESVAARAVFCEWGEGDLDLHGLLVHLREMRYGGWLTVELEQVAGSPKAAVERCRRFLETAGVWPGPGGSEAFDASTPDHGR